MAPTDSTVLITGETGTGKELIARAIHRRSPRAARAFVTVNCAAVPSSLIASELFGHEKGAFTGALQRRQGRFELADGGTIFLDEVGELPAETQVDPPARAAGTRIRARRRQRSLRVDVRVIAATNRDLHADVAGRSVPLGPLLSPRTCFPSRCPHCASAPTSRYSSSTSSTVSPPVPARGSRRSSKSTLALLRAYYWPGNIRELQNVIERAVIVSETDTLVVEERWLLEQPGATAAAGTRLGDDLIAHERARVEAALSEAKGQWRVAREPPPASAFRAPRSSPGSVPSGSTSTDSRPGHLGKTAGGTWREFANCRFLTTSGGFIACEFMRLALARALPRQWPPVS